MLLDYSKLEFDIDGRPEMPELLLETPHESPIGTLSFVSDLNFNIKFSEASEISFTIAKQNDGILNPFYDKVSGYKIIYTKHYGIYTIMNPETTGDGLQETKSVKGYSIEKTLETKKFFLEEGTFNFWNPAARDDTILGRILESAYGWSIGYVSPTLIGKYRTFSDYDDYLLSFMYNTVPDKFRCVFVFEPYNRTINVYDADEERPTLPIWLDTENLLQEVKYEEISDELVTALCPYGSDDLDIRDVNPTGTNWIYDISYFISNGDVPDDLALKWNDRQLSILNNQSYYKGLAALRASATAQLLSEQANLVDLNGELEDLKNQQSVTIQTISEEKTEDGKKSQQAILDDINSKIAKKQAEIDSKNETIAELKSQTDSSNPDSYAGRIKAITESLSLSKFFTDDERKTLSRYFIEQDLTEDTFVSTEIGSTVVGDTYSLSSCDISLSDSDIEKISLSNGLGTDMYTLSGGYFSLENDRSISGDIIRGTLETRSDGAYVLSIYAGSVSIGDKKYESGVLNITGAVSAEINTDISDVTEDQVTYYKGRNISMISKDTSMYITTNANEYQKYSVQMELYDYAYGVLKDLAIPTYEFSVDSGNFLFAKEFSPFRDSLELGSGVYLRMNENEAVIPMLIEIEFEFEDIEKFKLVFSNRLKRHDGVNTLKDMLDKSYSSSRKFDSSKYTYTQTSSQMSQVSKFMNSSLDAAVNSIMCAKNKSVLIDGAGIHVGGDSKYQMRIIDSMIAMSDDGWNTAKVGIGKFASDEVGEYFGVNAEVIGGKLLVGNNLVIENSNDSGVMQFKVDSTGAWLNNSTFVIQNSQGGKILLSPDYGMCAGTSDLYYTSGTTVYPSFIDEGGDIVYDTDGMPTNSSFYLDSRDGSAYFKGKIKSTSGSIAGWTLDNHTIYSGSGDKYVSLNSSGENDSLYAVWAGSENPASAPFSVKRDGTLHASNGVFSGTLSAAKISGTISALKPTDDGYTGDGAWIEGCAIRVGANTDAPTGYNFAVDASGNVVTSGSITLGGDINMTGNIVWGGNSPVRYRFSADGENWHDTMKSTDKYRMDSLDGGVTWSASYQFVGIDGVNGTDGKDGIDGSDASVNEENVFNVLTNGGAKFGVFGNEDGKLYINASYIKSGTLDADIIKLCGNMTVYQSSSSSDSGGYLGYMNGNDGMSTTNGMGMKDATLTSSMLLTNAGAAMTHSSGSQVFCTNNHAELKANETTYIGCIDQQIRLGKGFVINTSNGEILKSDAINGFAQIGSPNNKFNYGYFDNIYGSVNTSSDARFKNNINYSVPSAYEEMFLSLKPCTFKYNNGTSGRTHFGFIAQDVLKSIEDAGMISEDAAMYVQEESTGECSLRYGEFVALNTYMIQKMQSKIKQLEDEIYRLIE